jgi:hypothetical protein
MCKTVLATSADYLEAAQISNGWTKLGANNETETLQRLVEMMSCYRADEGI